MNLVINNRRETVPDDIRTIKDLLDFKKFSFPRIIVRINGKLIRKPAYPETVIRENDRIEAIHMISGG
ncbi:MAG: sulfur carrier protein ThiS [Bacteroidales bacterium]|nr:sulfur carrier protein ThiS [Bacteroidales bacterium]